ncbi:MAG: helix-turn-helix domain-containing protein [Muribaculaceae bacterium]|nr:helix-turn-helix domain-containing protein [Muribaculaceae bacterium]
MYDSSAVKKILGKNIKTLRLSKNLTQEQLAEIVGLERKSITAIETGASFTSSDVLAKLSNYFNVELDFFFKDKYQEPSNADIKRDIARVISDCNDEQLRYIFNFIAAIKR